MIIIILRVGIPPCCIFRAKGREVGGVVSDIYCNIAREIICNCYIVIILIIINIDVNIGVCVRKCPFIFCESGIGCWCVVKYATFDITEAIMTK